MPNEIEKISCAGCGREIEVEFCDNAVVSSPNYCLIADTIWHSLCWDKQCNDYFWEQRIGEEPTDEGEDDA